MNRVYKVIWSKAKHCYVVTSEIARSVTKSASSARSAGRKGAAVLAMAALLFTAGGVLGEAATANVTDVSGSSEVRNLIIVTKDDGSTPNTIVINNVEKAKEADHAKEADYALKATGDGNGEVIHNTYARKADVKKDLSDLNTNLSALDANLSALDEQVKKNTEAVVKVGKTADETFTDLYAKVQTNADAVTAEETARKQADQNNLKIDGDGVVSMVKDDSKPAVNKLVLNKDDPNQITLSGDGIKVGLNSGVMDKDGFYAGGDDYDHAGAALKWDGSIKGANGDFTVDTKGNADIGGDLTVDKNLTVNGTFDSKTFSSTLDAKDDYTTINGGNVTSEVNDKVGTVDYSAESIFNKDGSSITVRTNEGIVDSTGKSIVGAKEIRQYLGDNAKPDGSQKNVTRKMVRNDDGTFSMEDKAVDGKNKYSTVSQNAGERKVTVIDGNNKASTNLSNNGFNTYASDGKNKTYTKQTAESLTSQIGDDGKVKSVMNADGITNITGDNTVTSDTNGTTFENKAHNIAVKEGTVKNTTISGNTIETGQAKMDYADVTKDLSVGGNAAVDGNTTLGKEGEDTTLTVNSTSTFNKDVTMKENATVEKDLTVNGESTLTGDVTMKSNATVEKDLTVNGTSTLTGEVTMESNATVGNNLTVNGESTFNNKVTITKGGLDVTGDLNVDGNIETHDAVLSADSRQVVTGRQLYQTNERVDRLDNRIKKVGANAAALAALRPGDFNPDDKFSIAAGFGSYRNANAAALGLFYRPNENVLLSLGTSFGDGENMVNAGVSVKFGRGKSMAERRKEMADEVSSMRDEMRSQDERIAELEEMLKKQSELIEKLSKES